MATSAAGVEICGDATGKDSTGGAGECTAGEWTAGGAGRGTWETGVEERGSICVWRGRSARGAGAALRDGEGSSVAKDAARARANASSFDVSSPPTAAWLVSFKNENPEGAGAALPPPPLCIAIPEKRADPPGEFVAATAAAMRGCADTGTGPARSLSQRSSASEDTALTADTLPAALAAEPCGAGGGGGE